MRKAEVAILAQFEVALYELGPYSEVTRKYMGELQRRGLENQLEDAWVSYMAEREGVLEIGCEFDGKF